MHVESFKVFCDLAETGSFSAAAERNMLTQSAVSQQIRALEKRYTVKLIERGGGKPLGLTPEGEMFLESAEKILDIYGSIPEAILKSGDSPSGEVSVATVPNIGLYDMEDVRRDFRRKYPALKIKTSYPGWQGSYDAVANGDADFAIIPSPEKRDGFLVETVWHERLMLVCQPNHKLARYGSVGVRDLRGERFVWYASDEKSSAGLCSVFEKANVEIDVMLKVRYPDAAKRAIRVEGVVCILPESSVRFEVADQTLTAVEINSSDFWLSIGIVSRKDEPMDLGSVELVRAIRTRAAQAKGELQRSNPLTQQKVPEG